MLTKTRLWHTILDARCWILVIFYRASRIQNPVSGPSPGTRPLSLSSAAHEADEFPVLVARNLHANPSAASPLRSAEFPGRDRRRHLPPAPWRYAYATPSC